MVADLLITHAPRAVIAGRSAQRKRKVMPCGVGTRAERQRHPGIGVGYGRARVFFKGNVAASLVLFSRIRSNFFRALHIINIATSGGFYNAFSATNQN